MTHQAPAVSRPFGLVGTGVIGTGWAVRALARGLDVVATDPAAGAESRLRDAVDRAWPAAISLGVFPGADPARLSFLPSIGAVADQSGFIQESIPEREELKQTVLEEITANAAADVVVASSSSGLLPSSLQLNCRNPERVLVGHPFNPVYLLPLVEVVAGRATSADCLAGALATYRDLGMHPLVVRTEIEGYLADRLQEAVWREVLHLIADGVATAEELDEAIVYGPGIRWAAMGPNLTNHLAGGAGGMAHTLDQFGPALELPWARFAAPPLTPNLAESLIAGARNLAGGRSVAELERVRDEALISLMRSLRATALGSGQIIAEQDARTLSANAPDPWRPDATVPAPLELYQCSVEPAWVDYNRHMTESAYLLAFGWATDALFRYLDIDEAYRAAGHSYYTAETHITYLREVGEDAKLSVATRILGWDAKRLHIHHAMRALDDGAIVATTEQMLIHIDTAGSRSAPVPDGIAAALAAIADAHSALPVPNDAGRKIGLR